MARPRRDYLNDTASMVHEWANWCLINLPSSAIGFPKEAIDTRIGLGKGSNKPGSITPNLMMPRHVGRVDRAMYGIPADLYETIEDKYFAKKEVSDFRLNQPLIFIYARIN